MQAMYACIYMYIYIFDVCVCTAHLHTYVRTYIHTHACIHTYMFAQTGRASSLDNRQMGDEVSQSSTKEPRNP